jgi:hypothetical protein
MELKGPLLCSQGPAIGPCPKTNTYIVHAFPSYFPKIQSNIIFPSMLFFIFFLFHFSEELLTPHLTPKLEDDGRRNWSHK